MFTDIRKKSSSILVSLMFAAIIVTFVISFGPGDDAGCGSAQNYAASVDGDIITTSEFRLQYTNMYDYYQRIFKDFNNEMAAQYKLSEKALDGLIAEILLANEAASLGFRVSDDEVRKEILETPYFQQNGTFDRDSYNKMVQFTLNTTVAEYENKVRSQLLGRKLKGYLFNSIDVSDTEVKDDYIENNEKLDLFVYALSEAALKNESAQKIREEIKDEDADAFLKDNLSKAKLAFTDNVSKYSKNDGSEETVFENVKLDVAKDLMVKDVLKGKLKDDSAKLLEIIKNNPDASIDEISRELPDWEIVKKDAPGITVKSKFVQGVGFSPAFVEKVFAKKTPGILEDVFVTEEGVYVAAGIVKHIPADMKKFETEMAGLRERLSSMKKAQLLEDFIDNLRAKADISINQQFMKIYSSPEREE